MAYTIRLRYADGETTFECGGRLPFAPFVGLDILDLGLGQITIHRVAWLGEKQLFCCDATERRDDWSLEETTRNLATAGWEENVDAREPLDDEDTETEAR